MVQIKASDTPFLQPKTLRVRFCKHGRMQYISHLDLVRTMNRVIIRTRLPVAYSEGFNPIPRFSFAAPLSVGVESTCEIMDIRITHPVDLAAVKALFNQNLPIELAVYDAYMAEEKVTAIAATDYTLSFSLPYTADAAGALTAALKAQPLTVAKHTKQGVKDTDISPLIASAEAFSENGMLAARLSILAPNASFLNPDYVVTAIRTVAPLLFPEKCTYRILRTDMKRKDGSSFR